MAQDKAATPFNPADLGYLPQMGAEFLDPLAFMENGDAPKEDKDEPAVAFDFIGEPEDDKRDTSPKPGEKNGDPEEITDPDDGDGQDEELGELDQFLAKHGFKSTKALAENWTEQRKEFSQFQRYITSMERRMEEKDALILQLVQGRTAPEVKEMKADFPSGEKLTEMIAEKPEKFVELLTSHISNAFVSSPQMKQIQDGLVSLTKGQQTNQAKDVLYNLRTAYQDFGQFEDSINETLHNIGRDGLAGTNSQALLQVLYEHAKMRDFIPQLIAKAKELAAGNETVNEQAKRLSKTVKGGPQNKRRIPQDGDDPGQKKFKTRVGTLKAEDLDLLFDPGMASLATIPAKVYT